MSDLEFWKDLGNIFDAILNYQRKNVEFNNRFINPWIRLGNIFDRDDQHKEAVQAYRHAIELDPENAQNWADLGDVLFKMGAFEEAAATYQKAVELNPQAGWPISNLALCMVSLGHTEDGIHLSLKALDLLPDDKDKAVAWNRLGNAYRKLNDYENAFLAFQKADELDGDNTGFRDQLDESTATETVVAPDEVLVEMEMDTAASPDVESAAAEEQAAPLQEAPATAPIAEISEANVDDAQEIAVADDAHAQISEEDLAETIIQPQEIAPAETLVRVETSALDGGVNWPPDDVDAHKPEMKAQVIVTDSEPLPAWLTEEAPEEEDEPQEEGEGEAEASDIAEPVAQVVEEIVAWSQANASVEAETEVPSAAQVEEATAEPAMQIVAAEGDASENLSTTSTQLAETYTEFTSTPVLATPVSVEDTQPTKALKQGVLEAAQESAGEEKAEESAPVLEVQKELVPVLEEIASVSDPAELQPQSPASEAAYEEYLKDAVDPVSTLSDHIEDVHAPAPETRVSESGEVRIAMDTQNAHVWNELGNVYFNSGSCDDAISAYGRAIELDRQFAWPYSNLALAYVQKNRFAEAILLYQRSIELFVSDKEKAVTWNRLGNVYRRLNDYSNAIAAYQTADDLDPDNATLSLRSHYGLLGNLYSEQKPNYVS